MRVLLFVAVASSFLIGLEAQEAGNTPPITRTYELYSWQNAKGVWNFQLLNTTNRQKTVQEVFNTKSALRGVDELKRKISTLPASSDILWFDRLTLSGTKVRGSERLKYPPKQIIDDVKRDVESHGVKLSGPDQTS